MKNEYARKATAYTILEDTLLLRNVSYPIVNIATIPMQKRFGLFHWNFDVSHLFQIFLLLKCVDKQYISARNKMDFW